MGSVDEPIVFLSSRKDFYTSNTSSSNWEDLPDDNLAPAYEDLPHFVMRQIAPDLKKEDRPIAAHILNSLNENGLLSVSTIEIAQYHHVPPSHVEKVVRLIQHAEPLGVGSPTPQEALLVQLEVLGESQLIPEFADKAIINGFYLLTHHKYSELGKLLEIPSSQAKEIVKFISDNLNPYPAHQHWGDLGNNLQNLESSRNTFKYPDIIITRLNEREDTALVVEIAMPFYGTLRVNPLFRKALKQAPSEKNDLWRADLEKATLLVKCLQQRNNTIVRLMQRLTVIQRSFILSGDAHLHPITRAFLAKELDVHESTMSRAVSDKTVQLPNSRIVPLAIFFDRSLHIRTALKEIIKEETSPLNDSEIAELLAKKGHRIARRTVAKYRSMEGILPAHLRQHAR
jgi:RNA polymerase sigma-54 factor